MDEKLSNKLKAKKNINQLRKFSVTVIEKNVLEAFKKIAYQKANKT